MRGRDRTNAVAVGAGDGRHVRAIEDVSLFNLGGVEKDGKADGIKENDDDRVGSRAGNLRLTH